MSNKDYPTIARFLDGTRIRKKLKWISDQRNRETIRRTVVHLEEEGYVEYDDGLSVVDHAVRESGFSFLAAPGDVSSPSISETYVHPHFAGMDFAYTTIDAVYVWTRGDYQVARNPDDYPSC